MKIKLFTEYDSPVVICACFISLIKEYFDKQLIVNFLLDIIFLLLSIILSLYNCRYSDKPLQEEPANLKPFGYLLTVA